VEVSEAHGLVQRNNLWCTGPTPRSTEYHLLMLCPLLCSFCFACCRCLLLLVHCAQVGVSGAHGLVPRNSLAHGTKPAHHRRPPISVVLPCCCCLQLLFCCLSLILSPRTSAQSNICCRCHSFLPRPFGAAQYLVLVNLITLFRASLAPPNNLFSFDVDVQKK